MNFHVKLVHQRNTISFTVCYIVTFYRLILLIDIFICLVVTAVCLFFINVLQQQQYTHIVNSHYNNRTMPYMTSKTQARNIKQGRFWVEPNVSRHIGYKYIFVGYHAQTLSPNVMSPRRKLWPPIYRRPGAATGINSSDRAVRTNLSRTRRAMQPRSISLGNIDLHLRETYSLMACQTYGRIRRFTARRRRGKQSFFVLEQNNSDQSMQGYNHPRFYATPPNIHTTKGIIV